MEMESLRHPFPAIYAPDSRILILGSFPSVKSREQMFFYGHPQNRFWRVMAALLSADVPQTVEEHRRDLATAYEHGAAEAVSYTEEEQNKRVAAEKAAVNAEQARLLGAMAARVEQMHDAWVQELARRVTEE